MNEFREAFPEETQVAEAITGQDGELVTFEKAEVEEFLGLGCLSVVNWINKRRAKGEISDAEAGRWAKCTRIVFWQHLQHLHAGYIVWGLVTAGLFLKEDTKNVKK
jgi:hypothetical protein